MPKLSDLTSIRLGTNEVSAVFLGGQKMWPSEDVIRIVNPSYITPIQSGGFGHTTENDQELVLFRTNVNEKIQGAAAVASQGNDIFIVGEPFFVGDGTYAFPVAKTNPYGGYSHLGTETDTITVTVPGAESSLTIAPTTPISTDHDPYPRFKGPSGFCHIALVPYNGLTYTKTIYGFAYNAHSLAVSGAECVINRLTRAGSEKPSQKYVLASRTEFPGNAGAMATAVFGTVNRGDTSINITVAQNPGASPRIGYAEMVGSVKEDYEVDGSQWVETDVRMRNILLQDGSTKKFGYLGKLASATSATSITFGSFSRIFVLDLDELEAGDITLSKLLDSRLYFNAGVENLINVFIDNNTTPVAVTSLQTIVRYNLPNGTHTITIKKKTV